jgi:hypothetical protein
VRLGCRWPHQLTCAEVLVLTGHGRGRSNPQVRRRSGPFSGSTGGKRRPDPHGQGSLRPSFSTSSVSVPTTRSPRLTLHSLEGTPGGACWSAQKDASASRSRYMAILLSRTERQDRSENGRQVPANISGHSTALDKQQSRTTRGRSGRPRGDHRNRKLVKPSGVNCAVLLVGDCGCLPGLKLLMVAAVAWAVCGHGGWPGGLAPARRGMRGSSRRVAVSCRAVRLYVALTGFSLVPWSRPGSRQRAIELGARGGGTAQGLRRAAWPWLKGGLVPPPGGKLTGSAGCPQDGYLMRPPRRSWPGAGPGSGLRRCGRPRPGRW